MANSVAAAAVVDPATPPSFFLKGKENSVGFKILSVLPFVGDIIQGLAVADINKKITSLDEKMASLTKEMDSLESEIDQKQGNGGAQRIVSLGEDIKAAKKSMIALNKSARDYHIVGLVRSMITLAAVVVLFVLNIFGVAPLVAGVIATAASLSVHIGSIYTRTKFIQLTEIAFPS